MRSVLFAAAVITGLAAGVAGAGAASNASISAVNGAAFVMRGNTVQQLTTGQNLRNGDRIITSAGSTAKLSDGRNVGALSLAHFNAASDDMKSVSSSRSDNKSGKFNSGVFDDDKYDRDGGRNDHDGGRDNKDGHNHHDDPWKGHPGNPRACSD